VFVDGDGDGDGDEMAQGEVHSPDGQRGRIVAMLTNYG
jgi:hypothetical protein